jgi:hypothetical protein
MATLFAFAAGFGSATPTEAGALHAQDCLLLSSSTACVARL